MSKAFAILVCCGALCAQTTLKQLGYPEGTKLLIIHADDLGVAHSVNRASFRALDSSAVTSASIMVPCPWLTEVAAYAKEHPDADLGLHLTFTSEWKNYRWGPVSRANLGGLIAPDGYFWPDTPQVIDHARIVEVETELRAQIDRAIKAGIHPTHLDTHMGTLFSGFIPAYEKVAREYHLPFFVARLPGIARLLQGVLRDTDIVPDAVVMAGANVKPTDWKEFYWNAIRDLKPGLTEMIVHLGYDDDELRAVMEDHPAYGSAWRQRDFDLVTSAEFRKLLNDNHVKPIGWKGIKEHWGK
jgi:predicted glycoside hydrolase/deacetylase ChbG (UPF0249 family)